MNISKVAVPLLGASLMVASSGLALAQTNTTLDASADTNVSAGGTSVGASATLQARITKGKSHADEEIKRRVDMLNQLNAKVQAMNHVSDTEKGSVAAVVSTQIADLTALQAKIDADTDIDALKTDIHAVTQSYRIFMLVIPRGRIDVAADKINTAATALTSLSAKLQTRIDAASGAADSLHAQLNDMTKNIADAQAQANAAVSAVASLQPDNGDKTVESSNTAALKGARSKIQAALADLKTARQDAGSIVTALKHMDASGGASVHADSSADTSAGN